MPDLKCLYDTIFHHHQMGNINAFIQEIAKNRQRLCFYMTDLMPVIGLLVKNRFSHLSPVSVAALRELLTDQPEIFNLLEPLPEKNLVNGQIGQMVLALTTNTVGLVRDIRVDEGVSGAFMTDDTRIQLDKVGSAAFRIMRDSLKHRFFWNPKRYRFDILKFDDREDMTAKGPSLELALAICLYSHITRIPISGDVTATGAISRNGAVLPVAGLDLKLAALKQERYGVTRVLVSDRQPLPQHIPDGFTICPVKTLKQAFQEVFPASVPIALVDAQLDLAGELQKIESLYVEYYPDSCIQYSTDVIQYLENTGRKDTIPDSQRIPALFTCYWRKGSCWCHKGDIKRAFRGLKKAIQLGRPVEGKPQYVEYTKYLNCRINFAVLLKDVFRYSEADAEHREIREEMEAGHV
ncbi:MAG: S16 family serine protease, partial [Desulfatirhabdiaceae bacterium]